MTVVAFIIQQKANVVDSIDRTEVYQVQTPILILFQYPIYFLLTKSEYPCLPFSLVLYQKQYHLRHPILHHLHHRLPERHRILCQVTVPA